MKINSIQKPWVVALAIIYFSICSAYGANVQWTSNENVKEEHKDAHYAPRSQKYWDEHNIERPDYAKTDAEIAAERGEQHGSSDLLRYTLIFAIAACLVILLYVTNAWDWLLEMCGIRGHRLGSSSVENGKMMSEKEARLKRFENPKTMLDNMKAD